jgi:hypothetical protein
MSDDNSPGQSAERTHRESDDAHLTDLALRRVLLYGILPFWIVPGLADWCWHRKTHIETTSGTHESMTHAIMMGSIGVPLTLALLFDINALVLTTMFVGTAVHEGVTYWDVDYAKARREIPTIEQHTHSFLEMLPFAATTMACCIKAPQLAAIFGRGEEPACWRLKPKNPPLTLRYVAGLFASVTLGIALPYAEELLRCWRVDHTFAPRPVADA